jgi:hypothetical protein
MSKHSLSDLVSVVSCMQPLFGLFRHATVQRSNRNHENPNQNRFFGNLQTTNIIPPHASTRHFHTISTIRFAATALLSFAVASVQDCLIDLPSSTSPSHTSPTSTSGCLIDRASVSQELRLLSELLFLESFTMMSKFIQSCNTGGVIRICEHSAKFYVRDDASKPNNIPSPPALSPSSIVGLAIVSSAAHLRFSPDQGQV